MNVGIYVRVSTEEQAEEGYSIRAQEQKLVDFARIKEWKVYKVYRDEGISGKNVSGRPGVTEMIKDIKSNKIDNVLVYKIDRLTRSTIDLINFVDLFNEHDCNFNSLLESIDTLTASGRMFLKIIGIFAEFERENIVERTKLGFERKVREGYSLCTRTPSYGYDRENGNKIQFINPYEAEIVKEIYDMFLNKCMSFNDIARNLNKRNIPTKENKLWHSRTVRNVLTNCNYIGNVRYAQKDPKRHFETTGVHEPIISKEIFEETQDLISKICTKVYTKHPIESNYYCGFLKCGKCGAKLVSHSSNSKIVNGEKVWIADYKCSNRIKKKCSSSNVTHKYLEQAFIQYIDNFENFDVLDEFEIQEKEDLTKQNVELSYALHKQINKLDEKEKEILNLYINSKLDYDNYSKMKETIEKEKQRLYSQLEKIEKAIETDKETETSKNDIIQNFRQNWELLNNLEKRQFLVKFVDHIEVINEVEKGKKRGTVKILNVEFNKE